MPGSIAIATVTGAAAAKLALPGWLAVIEQEPAATIDTVPPPTVHMPVEFEEYTIPRPDDALAGGLSMNMPPFVKLCALCAPKVMLCEPWVMVKLCVTSGAA